MFKIWAITDGDAFEAERARENIEALRIIIARQPWKAKQLRSTMHAELRKLSDINSRYEA